MNVVAKLSAWCAKQGIGDEMTWVGKDYSLAQCKRDVAQAIALVPAEVSEISNTTDAEMMLRRILSRHRNNRPIPGDWWPHIERIAMRNASPLRAADLDTEFIPL